jgi:hypothetical protein
MIDMSVFTSNKQSNKSSNSVTYEMISLYIQMEYCDGMSLDKYLMNTLYLIDEKIVFMIFR